MRSPITFLVELLLLNYHIVCQLDEKDDWRCSEIKNTCEYGECRYRCLKESCNPQQTHIIGDQVLILDYNSLYYSGGDSHPVVVDTAAACCEECKRTKNCNSYAFCDNLGGCGEGCLEYAAQHPVVDPAGVLPFEGFGPYGGCYRGGEYPYQMCKLMTVSDNQNYVTSNKGKPGFISGVLDPKPARCGDLDQFVCEACDDSENFEQCFNCATQQTIPKGSEHYCGRCSALNVTQQDQCSSCLGDFGIDDGCGRCMVSFQSDLCLKCSQQFKDPRIQQECNPCSNRDNFQLCVDCLDSNKIDIQAKEQCSDCTKDDVPLQFQQRCVSCMERENGFDAALCGSCAASSSELEQCFECLEVLDGNTQRYCPICSTDKNPKQCYQCLKDEDVTEKVHCSTCALRSNQMDLCVKCLKNADRAKALKCTRCAQSVDEQACLNCYINSQDSTKCDSCSTKECYQSAATESLSAELKNAYTQCQGFEDVNTKGNCSHCLDITGEEGVSICTFCSKTQDPNACISCVINGAKIDPLISQACPTCMQIQNTNDRKQCLDCVTNSKDQSGGFACSRCARLNTTSCFGCIAAANGQEDTDACFT